MNEKKITAEGIISEALSCGDTLAGSQFPLHIFPAKFQDIARTTSNCLGYPLDFIAGSMLFVMSVAVGNTYSVKVKEGWTECAILYLAIVGKAGTNKSHPMSFAMRPLFDHDVKEHRKFKTLFAEYQELLSLSKTERENRGVNETPTAPSLKKFVVSDITQEGLAYIHEQNKQGICLYVDELKTWTNNFNRYSKGSEEQFWLSNFSGKPIIVDRRSNEHSISVRKSFISVIGSIQFHQLCDLAKGDKSDNGFIDRILFVVPCDLQKRYWSNDELPQHINILWGNLIGELIDIDCALDENDDPTPVELIYNPEAKARLYEWQRHNTDLCNTELNERLVGIYSKLEIYISRFSLLLQLIGWVCGKSAKDCIEQPSIDGAIELVEYFRHTAQRVQSIISNPTAQLSETQQMVVETLPETFTTAEGVVIAARNNIPERTFKEFVNRNQGLLFRKIKHGVYAKIEY
ncbi:DUF3987 domain-containing protein [Bacteroides sp.]|uniref:DUF3987 domain-containing protein n=1 Tax=Bacteroides sp. TaxID=29523 RepID=UPI002FC6FE97